MVETLEAPFPYFGGKKTVADAVWARFGDVNNYVEPFAGSLAMLLSRPTPPKIETVNDLDGFISNFWRSLRYNPEAVAEYADWPVSELDLHARHAWLVAQEPELVEKLRADPEYCDPKIAGWWVWGISQWIGSGWCAAPRVSLYKELPHLGDGGKGIHRLPQKRPHLGNGGQGIHSASRQNLTEEFLRLSARLRRVRIVCGDWRRICTPSVTWKQGLTGVFLDPPYGSAERDTNLYKHDSPSVASDVREWCLANGDNPLLRIALCGYLGEGHDVLVEHGWELYRWKANGGYGNQGNSESRGKKNAAHETIWFSPSCLKPAQGGLF